MKKSVIICLIVVYVFAIVSVGFLGMSLGVYDENRPVKNIYCVAQGYNECTEEEKAELDCDGYFSKPYEEGLKVEIKCKVDPDNATVRDLDFIVAESGKYSLKKISEDTALIEFFGVGTATVIVKATDNNGVSLKIQVYAFEKK